MLNIMVPTVGLEPTSLARPAPRAGVSACSTTSAKLGIVAAHWRIAPHPCARFWRPTTLTSIAIGQDRSRQSCTNRRAAACKAVALLVELNRPGMWWTWRDSNSHPSACKAAALPIGATGPSQSWWAIRESNPVCHEDTDLQSGAVASAAHCPKSGADEGARTPGLDVGNVAFYPLNYVRRSTKMRVRSDSLLEERATCIDMWSGRRGSNPRQQVWKTCALPAELHPQFRKRVRPSRVNVLRKLTCRWLSPLTSQSQASRVGRACVLRYWGIPRRSCDPRVRALGLFLIVKQQPGRTSVAGDRAKRTMPVEGMTLAGGTLFWVFCRL